uniref:Uncharacterized protein n=1 Tax=viral metagenome TaxID=1070528 RepID=A0A6H1ZFY5_9ZZZZ
MALTKGTENVSWGFRNPADGWHTVSFQEGIALKVNETSGKESLMVPLAVDEGSEDDGCKVTAFINTRDENRQPYKSVEKQIGDILTNAGLFDGFAKKFADADSYLDNKIIDAMKIKLPGTFVMVETRMSKDNKGNDRCNIQGWAPKGTAKEAKKVGKAEKKGAETKVDAGSDW